jgi:hypothetical protein
MSYIADSLLTPSERVMMKTGDSSSDNLDDTDVIEAKGRHEQVHSIKILACSLCYCL